MFHERAPPPQPAASNAIGGEVAEVRLLSNFQSMILRRFGGLTSMVGKRVQFDDERWEAVQAAMRDTEKTFQDVAEAQAAGRIKRIAQRKCPHPVTSEGETQMKYVLIIGITFLAYVGPALAAPQRV